MSSNKQRISSEQEYANLVEDRAYDVTERYIEFLKTFLKQEGCNTKNLNGYKELFREEFEHYLRSEVYDVNITEYSE